MATIGEMIVKLLADTGSFDTSMAEASATVKASSDAMAASYKDAMQSFSAFDAIQKGSLGTSAEVAAAQDAINTAQATGAFTAEELAAKQALVDAAMLKVGKETEAASGALSMFTRNNRTMYSTSALITDAMTGQFSRMRREVAALGNETGLVARAFQFMVSPIGLSIGAVAALGAVVLEADDHYAKFEQTILRTGDIIGMSAGELQGMADDVGLMTGHTFEAVDAVNALGASGRFTGDQLRVASEAAVNFATVTGEKVGDAAKIIESLQEKPAKAIATVNDQFHFLTQSQADLIEKLLATGQDAKAAAVAVQAFHDAMADRAGEMEAHASALARGWHDVSNFIQQAAEHEAEFIEVSTGGGDTAEKLAVAQRQLNSDTAIYSHWWNHLGQTISGISQQTISDDQKQVDLLKQQLQAEDKVAQAKAKSAQATAEQFDKATHSGKGHTGIGALEQQFQEQEAKAHASYDQMKQDAADFWNAQATDARNSAQVQAQAWQKYIQVRHQLDAEGLAADNEATRKREENARKASEVAKQQAQGVARAQRQASQEIQDEIKKEAAAQNAADLASIQGARAVALAKISTQRDTAQEEYSEGAVTAKQLLQIQEDLTKRELAALMAYYKAKEKLDQGNVAEVTKDAAQIQLALQKALQQEAKDEERFHQNSIKDWRKYTQQVAGMVASQTSAILFQHQSLKNALANILESMATDWIAGEARKLAATLGFGVQETAAKEAQRETNAAEDIADKSAAAARAAGLAGAQGIASFAAAPWPIDLGAPAFGAAMFAAAASFGAVASAAGGWERVPADGMQTILHKDEMVLPKHVADPMRNMARGGGRSGGGNTYHIHALDSRSFLSALKRNPHAMQMALAHATRNGW